MIKDIVIVEFKEKFYAQIKGILGALPLYNPDDLVLEDGQKLKGFLRGAGRDLYVHI